MTGDLDIPVLVLNRLWQPVNICSARRAVTLLFLGHAQVVHIDEEQNFLTHDVESWSQVVEGVSELQVLRSISLAIRVPTVIVLSSFDRLPRQEVKFTRQNVFERDGYTCQYCSKTLEVARLNLDHVIPREKGGRTTWENVVCSCITCNTRKANKLPADVNMFPAREPRKPRWRPFLSSAIAGNGGPRIHHESWHHFLQSNAETVEVSG
jgi:5-methylcytosine-specific restriction endonuclease McrA